MVVMMRLTMKANIAALYPYRCKSGLGDAPEERQRPADDARDVLPPGLVAEIEAGRRVDDILDRRQVEPAHGRLLLGEILGVEPVRHLGLDGRHVRPAEPGLVAIRADRRIRGRIDAVGAGMPGVEHAPAALARSGLLGAPGTDRAPVCRDEVDINADALEQIGR